VYYCFYLVAGRVFFFSIFLFSIFSFIFSNTMYDRFVYPFYGPYGLLGNILYANIYYISPFGKIRANSENQRRVKITQ
jgi:hypothetical protein